MHFYRAGAARTWTVSCLSAFLMFAPSAFSQSEEPVLELANVPDFNERYAGNTQVNGQFLSGLSYAATATKGALGDLKLGLVRGGDQPSATVCIRVTTDDGRYWAANMYRAKNPSSAPPKIPVPTRYAEQLGVYGADSLLLLATLAEDCNEAASKVYVPAIIGSRQEKTSLLAYVNVSQSRVVAGLEDEGKKVLAEGKCRKPAGGPRVTYSHVCEIPVPDTMKGATLDLVIGVKGMTGSTTNQRYSVHVE